jgi:4,5-dihydroxyphthalate decarboxylase
MPGPVLSTVTRRSGANAALLDGAVPVEGASLAQVEVPVLVDGFRRMVRGLEFDVCELALTTYVVAKAHGAPFTAIPVFLVRGFHHEAIVRAAGGDLTHPEDLHGRRVGVSRGYTVTTGVWARGVLAAEHGVDLDQVTWVLTGDEHVAAFRPPGNVVAASAGADLAAMVTSGELAAAVGVTADRPGLVPLLEAPRAAGYAALRERGHYPINHLVVVRDDVLAAHPGLAPALFAAFAESKRRYVDALRAGQGGSTATAEMHRTVMEITGRDPLPYGIEPNLPVLQELLDHALAQHVIDTRPDPTALFTADTRDLTA